MPIVCISHNSSYNRLVEFCLLDDDASKVMRNESKGTLVILPAGVSLGLMSDLFGLPARLLCQSRG